MTDRSPIPYGEACFCGCGNRAVHRHHVVYVQELRRAGGSPRDRRNLVLVAHDCHGGHHNRSHPYALRVLPDSVFEFAAEVLGPGPAFEYLKRRYSGDDVRLDALLEGLAA